MLSKPQNNLEWNTIINSYSWSPRRFNIVSSSAESFDAQNVARVIQLLVCWRYRHEERTGSGRSDHCQTDGGYVRPVTTPWIQHCLGYRGLAPGKLFESACKRSQNAFNTHKCRPTRWCRGVHPLANWDIRIPSLPFNGGPGITRKFFEYTYAHRWVLVHFGHKYQHCDVSRLFSRELFKFQYWEVASPSPVGMGLVIGCGALGHCQWQCHFQKISDFSS